MISRERTIGTSSSAATSSASSSTIVDGVGIPEQGVALTIADSTVDIEGIEYHLGRLPRSINAASWEYPRVSCLLREFGGSGKRKDESGI